ncbi:MAG TPA: hypothetical protein VGA53_05265 [Candidatus Paceibacterota bacterium]
MEVKISEKLQKEMPDVKGYGYGSVKEFIEDAIRRRILELKNSISLEDRGIAKLTSGFIARYRKDLEALAKK